MIHFSNLSILFRSILIDSFPFSSSFHFRRLPLFNFKMFRGSNTSSHEDVDLKKCVCDAVGAKSLNMLKDLDTINVNRFLEISIEAWESFYSCCKQIHWKTTQPIGLVYLESIGGLAIIKKKAVSWLLPCISSEGDFFS